MNSQKLGQHAQNLVLGEEGKWTQSPVPGWKGVCYWWLMGKGKVSFLQWSDTGVSTTLQDRPHAQHELLNTNQTLFLLLPFCLVPKRERPWSYVGREVEEELRGVGGRERIGSKDIAWNFQRINKPFLKKYICLINGNILDIGDEEFEHLTLLRKKLHQ